MPSTFLSISNASRRRPQMSPFSTVPPPLRTTLRDVARRGAVVPPATPGPPAAAAAGVSPAAGPAAVADDVEERLEGGSDGPLLQVRVEDDHELVVTQVTHLLLWPSRPRATR